MRTTQIDRRAVALRLLCGFMALATLAVAGGVGAQAQGQAGTAQVRVAQMGSGAAGVDVLVDEERVLGGLAFKAVSDYPPIPAGRRTLKLTPAGQPGVTLLEAILDLSAGRQLTLVATGAAPALTPLVVTDDAAAPAPGQARVRLVQAAAELGAIDVLAQGVPPLFRGVPFRGVGAYTAVPAGSYTLEVRPAGQAQAALTAPGVRFPDAQTLTLFLTGSTADASLALLAVPYVATQPATLPEPARVADAGVGVAADSGAGMAIILLAPLLALSAAAAMMMRRQQVVLAPAGRTVAAGLAASHGGLAASSGAGQGDIESMVRTVLARLAPSGSGTLSPGGELVPGRAPLPVDDFVPARQRLIVPEYVPERQVTGLEEHGPETVEILVITARPVETMVRVRDVLMELPAVSHLRAVPNESGVQLSITATSRAALLASLAGLPAFGSASVVEEADGQLVLRLSEPSLPIADRQPSDDAGTAAETLPLDTEGEPPRAPVPDPGPAPSSVIELAGTEHNPEIDAGSADGFGLEPAPDEAAPDGGNDGAPDEDPTTAASADWQPSFRAATAREAMPRPHEGAPVTEPERNWLKPALLIMAVTTVAVMLIGGLIVRRSSSTPSTPSTPPRAAPAVTSPTALAQATPVPSPAPRSVSAERSFDSVCLLPPDRRPCDAEALARWNGSLGAWQALAARDAQPVPDEPAALAALLRMKMDVFDPPTRTRRRAR